MERGEIAVQGVFDAQGAAEIAAILGHGNASGLFQSALADGRIEEQSERSNGRRRIHRGGGLGEGDGIALPPSPQLRRIP